MNRKYRKTVIAGNWKMNKTPTETKAFMTEFKTIMPRGRVQLEIGIQSTNVSTLAAVSRVNHWEKIANHIRTILGFHNMHLHVDLIIGLPGEGMASFHRSFNDVFALRPDALQLGF